MRPHLILRGFVTALLFLSAVGKGCHGPYTPQCFRRKNAETMYICEWSSPYKSWNHTVYMKDNSSTLLKSVVQAKSPESVEIREESLCRSCHVDIWVEAHNRTTRCASEKTSATLITIIKYERPQNVSVRWSQDNLTLHWEAPESYPAAVEIWHRKDSTQPWSQLQRRTDYPKENKYDLTVLNLTKPSVQELQMRQESIKAKTPLWSDWSRILTAPIEFVKITKKLENENRNVILKWKSIPGSDGETVSYQVEAVRGCPCKKYKIDTSKTSHSVPGSYSAVNISIRAMNSASFSPPTSFNVTPENPPDLKVCEGTALTLKTKSVCSEWYELRDGKVKQETVIILPSRKKSKPAKQEIFEKLKSFLPYVYFEHRCTNNRPRTVKMCLYYKEQDKPNGPPQHFINPAGSPTLASLSWEPIPTEKQRGFITHYSLCISTVGAQGPPDCLNISASLKNYTINKLTPGTKYNISLKGVTSKGEGPPAQITINTQHEKPYSVWLSFGFLIGFFFLSILCTFVFTSIKDKVLPPVPVPVIVEFPAYQLEEQDLQQRKEEADKVTLVQLHPERRPHVDTVTRSRLSGTPEEGSSDLDEEDQSLNPQSEDDDCTPKESTDQPADLIQSEIALLIYRNGLVFDVNMDSS